MEIRANFLLVGLFVLVTLLGALRFAVFILAPVWASDDVVYEFTFSSPAVGLAIGTPVYFNGLQVGEVTEIAVPAEAAGAVALARVDKATPVKVDTKATLRQTQLMGAAYINLGGASAGAPALMAAPGQRHPRLPVWDARRDYPDFRELWAHFYATYDKLGDTFGGAPASLSLLKWRLDEVANALKPLERETGGKEPAAPLTLDVAALAGATDRLERLVLTADRFAKSRKLENFAQMSAKMNKMSSTDLAALQRLAADLREKVNVFDEKIRGLGLAPAGPVVKDPPLYRK